jgi:hypothetical protein
METNGVAGLPLRGLSFGLPWSRVLGERITYEFTLGGPPEAP